MMKNIQKDYDSYRDGGDYGIYPPHSSTLMHSTVKYGRNLRIGPNTVIGGIAFLYPRDEDYRPLNFETLGGVEIGDNVSIGSNVCIERGIDEGSDTIIGDDVKIDNNVLIGHDTDIGKGTKVIAGTNIAGHVFIGMYGYIALGVSIIPHVRVGSYSLIGAGSTVLRDIPPFEVWAGNPARFLRKDDYFVNIPEDQRKVIIDEWE